MAIKNSKCHKKIHVFAPINFQLSVYLAYLVKLISHKQQQQIAGLSLEAEMLRHIRQLHL